jgi:lysyl-tRNA synthetase class 2
MDDLARLAAKKENLRKRDLLHRAVRAFFFEQGFLEVATPQKSRWLLPEEHIDFFAAEDGYLLPSPELHMKSLLAAGFERIFQISPRHRKGERGSRHLPEFTLLEWYRANADYRALMSDCEKLFQVLQACFGDGLHYQGTRIDLAPPWQRLRVREAFRLFASWDPWLEPDPDRFELDFAEKVIPALAGSRPVFLVDFPELAASLARLKEDEAGTAERFELFVGGLELANGFSELTDPVEQRRRFERANLRRAALGKGPIEMPCRFLDHLSRMPPSAGIALGMDRLAMLFTNSSHIEEVVAFGPEE